MLGLAAIGQHTDLNIEELTDKTAVLNSLEILIGERVIKNPRMIPTWWLIGAFIQLRL